MISVAVLPYTYYAQRKVVVKSCLIGK